MRSAEKAPELPRSIKPWDNSPICCPAVRHLLRAAATAAALLAGPAMAQFGGGDGAQVGANAYCGARASGRNHAQAQSSASWAMSVNMQGNLGSSLANIIVGGRSLFESMNYLISKQCPEYLGGGEGAQTAVKSELDDPKHPSFCNWHPWNTECKGKATALSNLPLRKEVKPCDKLIEKHECSYKKYLSANPSVENWAKANPAIAKKEAMRLGAVDADAIALPATKQASVKIESARIAKDIESKCLKAADYKGCMEYNINK